MCQEMIDLAGSGVEKYLKLPMKQKKKQSSKIKNLYHLFLDLLRMFVVIFSSFVVSFFLVYFILRKVIILK